MTRYERIKSTLDEMKTADLVAIHNEYCDTVNRYDDRIYSMDEFDEIMGNYEPWEIVRSAYYGKDF